MKPLIAIIGRPNVGKSTLFNRVVGRRAAIVEDVAGVTRDRHYADAEWTGRSFALVDTGGFEPEAEDEVRAGITRQARLAVEAADAILLVVDAMDGITPGDTEVVRLLRRSGARVLVVANKVDSLSREHETSLLADIHGLGLPTFPVSAEHGRGVGDLLDAALENLDAPSFADLPEEEEACRVAIVGRPNVGKSTLVNCLLGEERMLATELPGTTRDSVDAHLRYQGDTFILTDTAGIRRKKSVARSVERYSVLRAIRTIDSADIVVLMLDAEEPGVSQDERLAHLVLDRGRALILAVNKWDKIAKEGDAGEKLRQTVRERLPEAAHAPVLLVSALEGRRVFSILEKASKLKEVWSRRLPTPEVNDWLAETVSRTPPPIHKGRPVRLLYAAQIGSCPPHLSVTTSNPSGITHTYRRYLEKRMREDFGLAGVPIRFTFKARRRSR